MHGDCTCSSADCRQGYIICACACATPLPGPRCIFTPTSANPTLYPLSMLTRVIPAHAAHPGLLNQFNFSSNA